MRNVTAVATLLTAAVWAGCMTEPGTGPGTEVEVGTAEQELTECRGGVIVPGYSIGTGASAPCSSRWRK